MENVCWLLLTLLALAPYAPLANSGDTQGSVMEVRSGRELAMAFAASAHLDVALILADIWMDEADWHGILNGTEPVLLTKNFMILGSPSLPAWPLLNMNFVHNKTRIGKGVTLTVRHVVISDFRSDLLTQAPGFDLAAPTFPGGPPGVLLHNETAVTYSVCLPRDVWRGGITSSVRATSRPGTQAFVLGVPQDGCVNVTTAIATPALYPPSGGLALQPRLPSRCWADRGVFIDLAVPGADTAISPPTVPNNYDVVLINVTYMCARTITMECIGRLKNPYSCAQSMMQNDIARMPWRLPQGTDGQMSVRSGRDLAVAFAAAPLVTSVLVERDIWLQEADWDGLLGGADGAEPAQFSRNITVAGSPSLGGAWPMVNLGFVHDKVRIGNGVSLTAMHLILGDFRNEIPTQGPGFDLAAATLMRSYDMRPGQLFVNESALLYALCFPLNEWTNSIESAQRAATSPGNQTYQMGVQQDGCMNAPTAGGSAIDGAPTDSLTDQAVSSPQPSTPPTSTVPGRAGDFQSRAAHSAAVGAAAAAATAAVASSGLLLQPPLLSRCWATRGLFIDVGLRGADVDRFENQSPTNYDIVLTDVTYLCAKVMTAHCLTDHGGLLGCMTYLTQNMSAQTLPWRKTTAVATVTSEPPAAQPLPPAGQGDSSNSAVVLGAAIGGAVGGAVLLALMAVAVLLVIRRRKGRSRDGMAHPFTGLQDRIEAGAGAAAARSASGKSLPTRTGTANSADAGTTSDSVAGGDGADGGGNGSATATASNSAGEDDTRDGSALPGSKSGATQSMEAVAADGAASASGQEGNSVGMRGSAALPSSSDHAGDPLTRSGGDTSSGLSVQRIPGVQASRAKLTHADEHVVVTPLTPPRADLALGEAAAKEVTLLPVVRGKGAFGRVYEGLYGGEKVAVKVMRDVGDMGAGGGGSLEHVQNSFAQEVEVLGRCQHPNVVRLLAACLTPPKLLLVMELMETSLEKLVYSKTGGLLPLRTALYIALDVAKGLEYLHPTILHRDLKPGNVLINGPTSPRPVAKITDFGVSRLRSTVLITKHPEAGTPAYMAPETFDVKNYTLTHHVDIYSFGVLLWVLLTGDHPWRGFQMVEVAYKVTINKEKLPTSRIPPGRCPLRLRALMDQCWEYEPRRRPAAAEVVKELQSLLDTLPGAP